MNNANTINAAKDFTEMTANEIATYRGRVFWAKVEHRSPSGSFIESDFESPTYSHLHDHLNGLREFRVLSSGVSYRYSDGRTVALPEWLRSGTLDCDDIEAALSAATANYAACVASELSMPPQ